MLSTNLDTIINQRKRTIKEKFDCFMKTISTLNNGQINPNNFNHCYIYNDNELSIFYQKALDNKYITGTIKNLFVAFHFTKELKEIIEELGLKYIRVSSATTDTNKTINDNIIRKIKSLKIVIADFSGQRNSVYFEAGFTMELNIFVIWTCRKRIII